MRMTRLTTTALAAVLGCSGVLAAGSAAAGSAAAASAPLGCQYKVLWPTAGVYENPNPNSVVVKTKHAGDIVGASTCEGAAYNEYGYVLVATDAAADGRGWMRVEAVVQI
ncbi:glycosyltransferase [Streptomyces microflavus]|uniref:glycosyltransferase n=1 Tax=Streptomyces microflavus TaxID=1919 RepID=UPI0034182C5A